MQAVAGGQTGCSREAGRQGGMKAVAGGGMQAVAWKQADMGHEGCM